VLAQAKLQKAQQQREYAKAFHADVQKKLAAEQAAQQEAAAARSRLASLRARLEELQGMNADRRQRAEEVQEQVQVLKVCESRQHVIPVVLYWDS
jgi:ATPase subunit of ABC transporter with duplicated ATPase domains